MLCDSLTDKMVAIGIDLGTTYSCVGVWRNGYVEIIPNDQGNRTTPSFVAFTYYGRLVGEMAKNQAPLNPTNTVFSSKRLIGRKYEDTSVQNERKHWPFKIVNENSKPKIEVECKGVRKQFSPEEISSMILMRMKETAESYLGEYVSDAVITVPAYFNDSQRLATKVAGAIAGLNVLRIINEPTAAALAYGLDKNLKGERNILVYDLGGGTFDVSILSVGGEYIFEVLSTAGDTYLGGEDFDHRLVAYFAEDFRQKHNKDLLVNARALRRLKTAAERAKRTLSAIKDTVVEIEDLYDGTDYCGHISRLQFEDICADLFLATLVPVQNTLNYAGLDKSEIHEVVLIGGSTRIPKIQSMLQTFFERKKLNSSINPDEAVAYGAAVQAAILTGVRHDRIQDVLLVDVTPLSLGVETARGLMTNVINRNTKIPCTRSKIFTTLVDNQPAVTVEVFEGERSLTKDNNFLGAFDLNGIPPAPLGVPKIDVTFTLDADGILSVAAEDRATGQRESIIIRNEFRLTEEEIARMMEDARRYKIEDAERKLCLEIRNQLETYVFDVKQAVEENPQKLSAAEKEHILNECENTITMLDENPELGVNELEIILSGLMCRSVALMHRLNPTLLFNHVNAQVRLRLDPDQGHDGPHKKRSG